MKFLLFLVIPTALAIPTQCEIDCVARFDKPCASFWDEQCAEEAADRCTQCPVCDSLFDCPQANANYIYTASGGVSGVDANSEVCTSIVNSDGVTVLETLDGSPWRAQDTQLCFSQAAGNERCNRVHLFFDDGTGKFWCTCRTLATCTQQGIPNAFSQLIRLKDGYARASKCHVLASNPGYQPWIAVAGKSCKTAVPCPDLSCPQGLSASARNCAIAAFANGYAGEVVVWNPTTTECSFADIDCLKFRNQELNGNTNIWALPQTTEFKWAEFQTLESKIAVCQARCDLLPWCYSWAIDSREDQGICTFYGNKDFTTPILDDTPPASLVMGYNSGFCFV